MKAAGLTRHYPTLAEAERWLAADPEQYLKCHRDPTARMDIEAVSRRLPEVCESLSDREWPDGNAIITACKVEAVKAAAARTAAPKGGQVSATADAQALSQLRGKGKNIDARMLKVMAEKPESHGWSVRQWATHFGCSASTVADTKTWKERLKTARAMQRAEAATRMEVASVRRNRRS
jgi:hypothetical protein